MNESKTEFEKHCQTHNPSTDRTKNVCEVCGLEGLNKSVMQEHLEKMHTCLECNSLHKDVYELNRHKEKEHCPESHNCKECNFVTNLESDLKRHLASHEKEQYTCEVCEKKGNSQVEIDEHIQSTHVKEMFKHFVKRNETRKVRDRNQNRAAYSAKVYTTKERKDNGYCLFWNRGGCHYGEYCRFVLVESPLCRFQDSCFRKSTCKFFHENQSLSSFLGQGGRRQNQY